MLLVVGEKGYADTAIEEVAQRAGIGREAFRRCFGGKEECFARAYREAADQLGEELLAACRRAASWEEGLRQALAALLAEIAARPERARALLLEARAARGDAWSSHQENLERLAAALEGAMMANGWHDSGRLTVRFVIGAIEETICAELAAGRGAEVERLLPDLVAVVSIQLAAG